MNENINLCEILKDCPKGTKLYSPLLGTVVLNDIKYYESAIGNYDFPISTSCPDDLDDYFQFTKEGKYYDSKNGECLLFPSKDQRDWSKWECPKPKKPKFDPKTLQSFDKVLVKAGDACKWKCALFSHIDNHGEYSCCGYKLTYEYCIPYNDETKHLVGTTEEAPEYYRYWEN